MKTRRKCVMINEEIYKARRADIANRMMKYIFDRREVPKALQDEAVDLIVEYLIWKNERPEIL